MGKKRKKLLKAIRPFADNRMRQYLEERPDDTPVRLEVSGRNGYGLAITLGDMRRLWAAYDACVKLTVNDDQDCNAL